jgi:hypothetical protein
VCPVAIHTRTPEAIGIIAADLRPAPQPPPSAPRHPPRQRSQAALFVHLAEFLFQFGDQRLYALDGLIIRSLSRQRTVFYDLRFEFCSLFSLSHNTHSISLLDDGMAKMFSSVC